MIVHLNGWPGVGKRTIGQHVAEALGATFVHNHLLHDVAIVCAGLRGAARWPLYETVRAAAYDVLARRPAADVFVMTNALCVGADREVVAWRHVVELAIARCVPLIPVVLDAERAELCRRVQAPERRGRKLTDPSVLRAMLDADALQQPDVPELLRLDVTALDPERAAERIVEHVRGLDDSLQPANAEHLGMRNPG